MKAIENIADYNSRIKRVLVSKEEIAAEDPNVMMATYITDTFTEENGMLDSNPIHYSQKGRTAIALAIEDKITVPTPSDNNGQNLLFIVPILLIVAILIMAARALFYNRD